MFSGSFPLLCKRALVLEVIGDQEGDIYERDQHMFYLKSGETVPRDCSKFNLGSQNDWW
jgi:hypothetical protein